MLGRGPRERPVTASRGWSRAGASFGGGGWIDEKWGLDWGRMSTEN